MDSNQEERERLKDTYVNLSAGPLVPGLRGRSKEMLKERAQPRMQQTALKRAEGLLQHPINGFDESAQLRMQ